MDFKNFSRTEHLIKMKQKFNDWEENVRLSGNERDDIKEIIDDLIQLIEEYPINN